MVPGACPTFVAALERVRQSYGLCIYGYVIMPEHVHLLVNEPERSTFAQTLKSLKQGVARRLALRADEPFWQEGHYDFTVWSKRKFGGEVTYLHRNPVKRGLVAKPEDWPWSSFRHYATGEIGIVEIESQWTARRRERSGILLTATVAPPAEKPAQAKLERGTLKFRDEGMVRATHRCEDKRISSIREPRRADQDTRRHLLYHSQTALQCNFFSVASSCY